MKPKMTATDTARFFNIALQSVHKKLKAKALSSEKTQNRVYFGFETARSLFPRPHSGCRIVSFQIVKGGTGKTSVAHSVAVRANLYGLRVLLIDLDQQGNLSQACGVQADALPCMIDVLNKEATLEQSIVPVSPGLDIIPSRIENATLDSTMMINGLPLDRVYRDRLEALKKRYDLIVIDCPPAIGHSVAAATLSSDLIVAPVTPEKFCLSGLEITLQEVKSLEERFNRTIPIKIVLNKFDGRVRLSHEVLSSLLKHRVYGELMFRAFLRNSQDFPNVIAKNQSVFDPVRDTPAKEDADLLTREIIGIRPSDTSRAETKLHSSPLPSSSTSRSSVSESALAQ